MTPNEKSICLEDAQWCPIHLLGSHSLDDFNMRNDARFLCGINNCNKHHHKSLHDSTSSFVAGINSTSLDNSIITSALCDESNVLLLHQSIMTLSGSVNCFFDNGSSCCLITFTAATRFNLFWEPVTLIITTVTGKEHLDSFAYSVSLVDKNQETHVITAYGISSISNDLQQVDISGTKAEFSQDTHCIWHHLENRPQGEIELLVGMNRCCLHPCDMRSSGENHDIYFRQWVLITWFPFFY